MEAGHVCSCQEEGFSAFLSVGGDNAGVYMLQQGLSGAFSRASGKGIFFIAGLLLFGGISRGADLASLVNPFVGTATRPPVYG